MVCMAVRETNIRPPHLTACDFHGTSPLPPYFQLAAFSPLQLHLLSSRSVKMVGCWAHGLRLLRGARGCMGLHGGLHALRGTRSKGR
jgi:hypothetical protein